MTIRTLFTATALSTATIAAAFISSPALAQAEPITSPTQEEIEEDQASGPGQDIVVTGSRIARPETSGVLPGVQVTQEQIATRGFTNAIDVINDIPLVGTGASLSGSNGAGQPTSLGLGFADLLDLGTSRTLTLVNGRRFVGGNSATLFAFANETGGQVDVNSIPTLLIERVDVVTVGGAAAYGTDAIAGVINYILRDNFEGIDVSALSNITERGDGFGYNLRALAGKNFNDGGNIVANFEYSRIDFVNGAGRPFIEQNPVFVAGFDNGGIRNPAFAATIPATNAFLPVASDGAPGNRTLDFARSLSFSYGGNIFEPNSLLPAQNRVGLPGQFAISPNQQLIPGTVVSAAQAGCATTNARFCNFAPSALPGTGAAQAAFAQAVIASLAPGQAAAGTQAERNALALSLLQANRPTPREFFANNPDIGLNSFLGQFIPGFIDVANPDTRPVTIAGSTVPLNTILPRVAVPLRFNNDGSVVPFNAGSLTPTTPATFGSSTSPDGFFDPRAVVVRPEQDRYLGNLIGQMPITDNISFFTENLYSWSRAVTPRTVATANAITAGALETAALIMNVNNPYLDAADRAALATYGITPTARNGNFVLSRVNQDILGDAPNTNTQETFRVVNGFRGDFGLFGKRHNWEVSGAYGQARLTTTGFSLLDVEYALAVDTVRDASGQIRCRAQVDPTAANNLQGVQPNIIRVIGPDGVPRETVFTPTADASIIAACQPLNPFGFNQMSDASKEYVTARARTRNRNEQLFFQGLLNGGLFTLPGGDLLYGLSAEYRRDDLSIVQDQLQQLGRTRSAPTSPTQGFIETLEGSLEFAIPIFGDDFNIPLFRGLEFNPSARVTKQTGSAPDFRNVAGDLISPSYQGDWEFIYSLAGTWRPIEDLSFRGNYTRSLRQPNVVELFLTNQSAFAATLDPCSNQRISLAANAALRQQNCAQLVVAAGLAPDIAGANTFLSTFRSNDLSQPVAFAGNPGLSPEVGRSWTVGGIFNPRFLPRLTINADYINLKLDNQIIPTNPTQAAGFCVDSPTFPDTTPQFGTNLCEFIPRGADFQVQPGAAGQFLNLSSTELEGVNISAIYTQPISPRWGALTLRANAFHYIRFDTSATGTFEDRQRSAGSFGRPSWETVSSIRYDNQAFYTQLTHRFQSGTTIFSGGVPATIEAFEIFRYPELHYFDLAIGADFEDGVRVQLAITNLTDRTFAGQTGLFFGQNFDTLGRRYQLAVGKRF